MCARLLSCPLCSQPGFLTLDALRAGLVSVATRPLACPVCNETLLGIDKLTIHLFGHTINSVNDTKDHPRHHYREERGNVVEAILPDDNWEQLRSLASVVAEQRINGEKINFTTATTSQSSLLGAPVINNKITTQGSRSNASLSETNANKTIEAEKNNLHWPINIENISRVSIIPSPLEKNLPSCNTESTATTTTTTSLRLLQHETRVPSTNGTFDKNIKNNSDTAQKKEDIVSHYSDTWIDSLLSNENDKCDAEVSSREEAVKAEEQSSRYSSDGVPGKSRISNSSTEQEKSTITDSNESIVRSTNEQIFDGNNQQTSCQTLLLPQWKAFRLLAMKEKTERCDICGIHFPDLRFLVLHKQLAHMISEKEVNTSGPTEELVKNCPCHLCTKVFKTRGTLMVHMRVAHMGYNLGFLTRDNRESESTCCENGYNCPTCGKNFKKEQHVTQHLKTHEGKQWECDVCSKMFTTKYFLKKHKRLHSGEMPYKCTICDKTFTFQQSYHKHRLYHKDDKPHTCATCGRSFKELSTLHNHERIHTGEKPFVCETCGKCFRQRVSYLVHRRIHTGVMPYQCTVCGKNFRYKVSQRTHKCPSVQPEDTTEIPQDITQGSVSSLRTADCSIIPKAEIYLQNQSERTISDESNKFILIVNRQGQPILTREADVAVDDNYLINEKRTTNQVEDNVKTINDTSGAVNNLWTSSNCLSRENNSKESLDLCPVNQDLTSPNANDFFSLVMSPMENDISSPSTEMEHLRLSSPLNDETRQNETHESSENTEDTSSLQRDLNNAIDGIIQDNRTATSPLQTINEESLKQLLYGIDRKV